MTKVKILLVIATVIVAVSAYPWEENVPEDNESPAKVSPILLTAKDKQKQNDSNETANSKNDDDTKQDSNSSESTEIYIEETYIEVLLPNVSKLNSTALEALLNVTANNTGDDDHRLKRNLNNQTLENVSPPTSGSTVPSVLYSLRNSNGGSAGSSASKADSSVDIESKVSNSSSSSPELYQLRNLNTRPVRSSKSSEENSKESKESSEESSEKKSKASNSTNVAPPSNTLGNLKKNTSNESSEDRSKRSNAHISDSSSSKDSSDETSRNSTAAHQLYELRNLNPRPVRSLEKSKSSSKNDSSTEKENSSLHEYLLSNRTGTPVLNTAFSSSLRQDQKAVKNNTNEESNKDSLEGKIQQPTSTVATRPLYSAQNFYSRPERDTSRKDVSHPKTEPDNDKSQLPSSNTKNPALQTVSDNKGLQSELPNNNFKSSSRSKVDSSPVYSAQYSNVRHVREVVDSSEDESSVGTASPVVYITPKSRALNETKKILYSKPSTAEESLKVTSVER